MKYTIKEAAQIMNLPSTTIRYYDKEGLLPYLTRKGSGYRLFAESDIAMLRAIECLKKTGMPIKEIKQFIELVKLGDDSLNERQQIFFERKKIVEAKMAELQEMLDFVNQKCRYYETAIEAGTEKIHLAGLQNGKFPCEVEQ